MDRVDLMDLTDNKHFFRKIRLSELFKTLVARFFKCS